MEILNFIIPFIILITVVVFIHEYGHYWSARLFRAKVTDFSIGFGKPLFQYLDKNGKIAIDWGVYGIPETFVVNSNGIIKYRHVGPITETIFEKMNLLIKEIK